MATLLSISVALLAGLLMTRLIRPLKLPDVTAYLVAGVLIGPYCLGALRIDGLGFTSMEAVESLSLVSEIALGFIAFAIGNEFRLDSLKHTGRQAFVVGVVQALTATLFVDLALLLLHFALPDKLSAAQAITLGAIAAATAPAATLMVVRQYKAKGPLTNLLLPVVALDDAVGLVVFAVSFGIARTLNSGAVELASILVNPLLEIAASLTLGAFMGFLLTKLETLFHSNTNRRNMTIAFVFLTASLSMLEFRIGPVTLGLPAGLHDAGHGILQPLPPVSGSDGSGGQLDLAPLRRLFRHQRRGAGAERVCRPCHRARRRRVHPVPFAGKIRGRFGQHPLDPLSARRLQISGDYAAAAGRRGAWHVHYRPAARPGGGDDPQYHPVLGADLRAVRSHADQAGTDQGRGHSAHGRGRPKPPADQAGTRQQRRP